ncbi:hypothetical protein AN958_00077 [Leucoagaricus sp. SymC.cos]|nr:hypothetical protein AN958_00077 [Leucoagaricus sp. SymC.cos]
MWVFLKNQGDRDTICSALHILSGSADTVKHWKVLGALIFLYASFTQKASAKQESRH